MASPSFRSVHFLKSAATIDQLPADRGAEVAFVGRSNAGKSSALNAICGQAGLARTSRTPGRTQLLNVFALDPARRLIDLPGYGYAKVPETLRWQWRRNIDAYLCQRRSLRGVVLIMDARHPLTEFDRQMLAFGQARSLPIHALLTKADKLARGAAMRTLAAVADECRAAGWSPSLQLFSATAGIGLDEARAALSRLLAAPDG
jgi:GTP-binding protein